MPQEGVLHAVGSSTCSSAAASSGSSHPTCIRVPCRPPCLAAGLQAIAEVAASIKAGYYTVGIAGGVSLLLLCAVGVLAHVRDVLEMSQAADFCPQTLLAGCPQACLPQPPTMWPARWRA